AKLHTNSWRTTYRGILRDDYLDGAIDAERLAHWSARLSTRANAPDWFIAIAERNGEPTAFVCALLDADPIGGRLLDNLHVSDALKGTGIGTRLMREAAAWVQRQQPRSRLYLWVYEQNAAACRFYEGLGGTMMRREARVAPDGSRVAAVQYGWDDVSRLARA